MGRKKKTEILIFGIAVIAGILFWASSTRANQVDSEFPTQSEPVEKLAKELFIKEINVYEDHIVIQIDKDLANSKGADFMGQVSLFTDNENTFQARQSELKETGRIELQIGEAIVMPIAYYSYFATLREIKDGVAYIDVEVILRATEMVSGVSMEPEEITQEEYTVEIEGTYKRAENE